MVTTFINRMILSAKLKPEIYEEVESDRTALTQAMGVVILSSLAAGIGSMQHVGLGGLLLGTISALIGWFIWAGITYVIGTRLLPEPQTRSDYGEMLRTIGFSSAPGIIRILGIIPGLMNIVFLLAGIWMLVAMVIAVRQALDYRSTLRAAGVCLIGWVIQAAVIFLVFSIIGFPAGGAPAG
jgi:hypothetical protein